MDFKERDGKKPAVRKEKSCRRAVASDRWQLKQYLQSTALESSTRFLDSPTSYSSITTDTTSVTISFGEARLFLL
jgi:hypothetical protein